MRFPPKDNAARPEPSPVRPVLVTPKSAKGPGAVPGALLMVAVLAVAVLGSLGVNAPLAWLSAATLAFGVTLLWRPGEPLVLLFIFLLQWSQASTAILQASLHGVPIDDYFEDAGLYSDATALTLCALSALALGMRVALPGRESTQALRSLEIMRSRPLLTWFQLYLVFWIVGTVANYAADMAPGLSQVLQGVNGLRWTFFFLLARAHFAQPKRSGLLFYLAFIFELGQGLGGYFSDFKTVFVITLLALMTAGARLSVRWLVMVGAIGAAALWLTVLWTAVKPEYRAFVSAGERSQIVTVDYEPRMQKLAELALSVDEEKFSDAIDELLTRLSYVEFFGATLLQVPAATPHENGAILLDAIARPFTPRLLFPDKSIIDDSERTRKYTGRLVSGAETGTSISLGWVAETYIDFGRWFMMAAALGIGLFYGTIQRFLMTWRWSRGALGGAAVSAVLVSAAFLESSITKVTGGLAASLIAAAIVFRFVVPVVAPWLAKESRGLNQRAHSPGAAPL